MATKKTSVDDGNEVLSNIGAGKSATGTVRLSPAHIAAVNRRRRIIVQYDASNPGLFGKDIKKWGTYHFNVADEPGSRIDNLCWDIAMGDWAVYPSKVLPPFEHPGLKKWQEQGIDWVRVCVEESKKRNLEAFWNYRISESDIIDDGHPHPMKEAHPDWVIKSWSCGGLWNMAVPEVREYKLRVIRELVENYDFDGIQLDFARHVPCLPPGYQWEKRECVTEFVRRVRLMLLEVAKEKERPILLSAKVPENMEGCRIDGVDVETWAQKNLVDMFSLGSRSIDVDLAAFRRLRSLTAGKNIKLYPCFDIHHTTEAYYSPPIEFFRGVYANWWQQGADGVETFNWSCASPEACREVGIVEPGLERIPQRQAYQEIGDPETMKFKNKMFVVQRRGGNPYLEGYFNSNGFAQLPAELANDGRVMNLTVHISDDVAEAERAGKSVEIRLRVVVFNPRESFGKKTDTSLMNDHFEAALNGISLELLLSDDRWKDQQIFSPGPLPSQMPAPWAYKLDPEQSLLLLVFKILPEHINVEENRVSLRVDRRGNYPLCTNIKVEKVEVHVTYGAVSGDLPKAWSEGIYMEGISKGDKGKA